MLHKHQPNDKLKIPYREWNELAALTNARDGFRGSSAGARSRDVTDVFIRNDSGTDKDRFSVLGITGLVFSPTDAEETWNDCLKGSTAVGPGHVGKYVVCQEPIANGAIGRARLIGLTRVKIWMADTNAPAPSWAEVDGDLSGIPGLPGTSFGSARVIYCEPTGTNRWALVRLGNYGSRPERLYTFQQGSGPGIIGDTFIFAAEYGDDVGLTLAPTLDYLTPTVFGRATIHFGASLTLRARTDNPLSIPNNNLLLEISPDAGVNWQGVPRSSAGFGAIMDRQSAPQVLPFGDLNRFEVAVQGVAVVSLTPGYRLRMRYQLVAGAGGASEGWLHVTR